MANSSSRITKSSGVPASDSANAEAMARLLRAEPFLEDVRPAIEVVPGMKPNLILHAGPPIAFEDMSTLTRGAVIASALFEGLVKDASEVPAAIKEGRIELGANHDHGCVGSMAGPTSASRAMYVVRNRKDGNVAQAFVHEGQGEVMAYGAYSDAIIKTQRWVAKVLQPILGQAVRDAGGIDLRAHIAEALLRGDELHSRNKAATSLVLERLAVPLLKSPFPRDDVAATVAYYSNNHMSFATLAMAACKASLDAAAGVPGSSLVTAYARNGATVGLKVSGLGNKWFTTKAPRIKAHYYPGFSDADACLDIGDSVITECGGLGQFAVAASPATAQMLGRSVKEANETMLRMYDITLAEHPFYRVPSMELRGTPIGIDVQKVVKSGIAPICNTSTANRKPGAGIIGVGVVEMQMDCFRQALAALSAVS
jgi:hypothetical protein